MISQLLRSATSVGANTVESQGGQSRADFISKLSVALKECNESVYWLRLLVAAELTPSTKISGLQSEGEQIAKVLASIIVSTRKNAR
jgi:four helix bundle protein